jgi:transcriptional regulator with XRE-family HTH domain
MTIQDTFGWRLKMAREAKGMSQKDLVAELRRRLKGSDVVPPSKVTYSKMENGIIVTPKHEVLAALADILECSVDYLVTGKEPETHLDQYISDEANTVAQIADKLPAHLRSSLLEWARLHQRMYTEQRRRDEEMAKLIMERISLLERMQSGADLDLSDELELTMNRDAQLVR